MEIRWKIQLGLITFWALINFSRKMPSNVSFVSPSCFLNFSFSCFIFKRSLDNSFSNLLDSSTSFDKMITSNRTTNSITVKTKPTMMRLHLQNLLGREDISSRSSVISLCFSLPQLLFPTSVFNSLRNLNYFSLSYNSIYVHSLFMFT